MPVLRCIFEGEDSTKLDLCASQAELKDVCHSKTNLFFLNWFWDGGQSEDPRLPKL